MLWNRLPMCMKEINSLDKFKKELKTHLFKEAFGLKSDMSLQTIIEFFLCYIHVSCWYMNTFYRYFLHICKVLLNIV